MGNCMNGCLPENHDEEMKTTTKLYLQKQQRLQVVKEGEERRTGVVSREKLKASSDGEGNRKDETGGKKGDGEGILRVKIVLTKEELQWLMMQLRSDGKKRLENMLEEIERGRKKAVCEGGKGNGWKPSLESIMETPECVLEMNPSIRP